MNVSRDEATQALDEIGRAGSRMAKLSTYAEIAPMIFLWGVIWLVANLVTEFRPEFSARVWQASILIGSPLTLFFTVRRARRSGARIRQAGGDPKALGNKFALLGAAALGFVVSILIVVGPLNERQYDAFFSLFYAFAYAIGGVWGGWRLIAIGAAAAAATLFGYLELTEHFYLWMGLVGGGALILGGLWLWKA